MYKIIYRKTAQKALLRLSVAMRTEFRDAFCLLAENPNRHGLDVKPLQGREGFRLRIGQWRAIYRVERERLIILVLDIGSRGDIYK
jgi:mRNA interferase RelE/StbE